MSLAAPRFSVLLQVGAGQATQAAQSVESVLAQSFADWELIVIEEQPSVWMPGADPRLRALSLPAGEGAATLRNHAVTAALGRFLVVLGAGDTLAESALAHLARAIRESPCADVIYTDEDTPVAGDGSAREPILKTDWSPERLRHVDYIGTFRAMRTALVREVGGYLPGAAGEFDLTLRVTECAREVVHVPRALCHRSGTADVVDDGPARAAVQAQLDRMGVAGTVLPGLLPGFRRVVRVLDPDLRVSIIVPTLGQSGDVGGQRRCFVLEAVRSALAKTQHRNVEIVVVYDQPTPAEVLAELGEIAGDRLVLVPYDKPFNFSEKCNLGFLRARGDIMVLLNDDTEAKADHWLEALVSPLAHSDVGMTGAKLLYPDGTIQHGGHLYARRSGRPYPWHAYRWAEDVPAEYGAMIVNRECSGATAACVALRREVYEQIGGLCETLPGSYNDVDLSLKIRHAGLSVLWVADCELYHFESQTREPRVLPQELAFLATRWAGSFGRDGYLPWLQIEEARKRPVRA